MFRNKNEQGLTLIELLITISVLAVVSAIALPVINNVVTSSNSNALQQTIKDADAFIKKYSASGVVLYDGLKTLTGYVDTDGDNVIEAGEKMDSLTLDSKYSMSVTGSAQVGGSYTNGGVTAATITSSASSNASGGGATQTTVASGNLENWNSPVYLASYNNYPYTGLDDTSRFMLQQYGSQGTYQVGDTFTLSNVSITSTGNATDDAWIAARVNAFNASFTVVTMHNSMGDIMIFNHTAATAEIAQYLKDNGYSGVYIRGDFTASR